jgi:RHS repeat-associated protein
LTADHLGSTRLVTSSTGAERRCLDYLPFGEQMTQGMGARGACYASATEPRVKFTGKERDQETGLDYFLARYYSAAQGRFTSPDEFTGGPVEGFGGRVPAPGPLPYADITNPQSLNKYAYALNNPLRYVDPDGHETDEEKLKKAAQGAGIAAGQTLTQDSYVRSQYSQAAQQLKAAGAGPEARTALKEAARELSSPTGKEIAAYIGSVSQSTAGKTAEQLAESVGRTNPTVNAVMKNAGVVGPVLLGAGATMSVITIANAPEAQRGRVAAGEAGAFAGGIAGGIAGAKAGAVIGSFFGPGPGTAIGAGVGTVIGGAGGAIVTSQSAQRLYDWFTR